MQRDKTKIAAAPFRLSWAAILGGMFSAAATWLLLHALGLGLGLSQLEPSDPSSLRAIGIGSGIWTVVSSMISLFAGGIVTARAAGILGRSNAALHGIVLWGVTTVGALALLMSVVGSMARGVTDITVETATITRSAAPATAQALGINAQDLIAPLNERLRSAGKAPITAQQLESALTDAAQTALREGRLDEDLFARALADNTALDQGDVRELMAAAGQQRASMGQRAAETAERAADMTGRAFWALFSVMLLSLVSAVLGAITGVTRRQRELSARAAELPSGSGEMARNDAAYT